MYWYVTHILLVCTHMYLNVTCMYSYATCMYSYVTHMYLCGVLISHDPINHAATNCSGKIWVHGLVKLSVGLVHLSYSLSEGQFGKPILSAHWTPTFLMKPTSASTLRVPGGSLEPLIFAMRRNTSMPFSFSPAAIRYRGDSGSH